MLMPLLAVVALMPAPRSYVERGGDCVVSNGNDCCAEVRVVSDRSIPAEGYQLDVAADGVTIASSDKAGAFYARQTLRQLVKAEGTRTVCPCVTVRDWPAYRWRGVHFDDCRHYFGKNTLKHVLDLMAQHKLNVLHWHLTDDQGWRLDVPGYPELVKYGSVRPASPVHRAKRWRNADDTDWVYETDGQTYGPFFYSEQDIREIVAYAAERHVMIVPEIELPGHVYAALAAYPELACRQENLAHRHPRLWWGVERDVMCLGNDRAIRFMEDVLDYVCRVFPAPYVHIGGDECPSVRWKNCPKCQVRVKAEGLRDEKNLQSWITRHFVRFLEKRGKRTVGWDEYLNGDVPLGAVGMLWRVRTVSGAGHRLVSGAEAAEKGHDMVMCPAPETYFYYSQGLANDPYEYGGKNVLPLERVYAFDPACGVSSRARGHVLGGQCCNWSEYTWGRDDLDWKLWPRGCAMAEALWLGAEKPGFDDFMVRLKTHRERLVRAGVHAAPLPTAVPAIPWCGDLWSGNGGVWEKRLVLTFVNPTDEDWIGRRTAVRVAALGCGEQPIRELRLTDAQGTSLQLAVRRPGAATNLSEGNATPNHVIVFPLEVPAGGRRTYCLYYGNPKAWPVCEYLSGAVEGEALPQVKEECLRCRRIGGDAPWPEKRTGAEGTYRVPITVSCLSARREGMALAALRLSDAVHARRDPDLTLTLEGRKQLCARYGDLLLFPVRQTPNTVLTYYLYVQGGGADSVKKDTEALMEVVTGEANLLRDGAFETALSAESPWCAVGPSAAGVTRAIRPDGGVLGPGCAAVEVPTGAATAWRGISQRVNVSDDGRYLFGVLLKAERLDGEVRLEVEVRDRNGIPLSSEHCQNADVLRRSTDWTGLKCVASLPTNAASVAVSVIGKYTGTVSADAAVVARCVVADVGAREYPQSPKQADLKVTAVSPTVKVFPDERLPDRRQPSSLSLARNEAEDLQYAVRSDVTVDDLILAVEPPCNAAGHRLQVATHRVDLVPVDNPSVNADTYPPAWGLHHPAALRAGSDGWKGWWPDPLVRTNACRLVGGETRAFRVTVKTAAEDPAGDYCGRVRWIAAGRTVREDAFDVHVWDFDLPRRPTFSGTFDIRFEQNCWKGPGERDFAAAATRLMDLMAEYKVSPSQFPCGTIFRRDAHGGIVADFAEHDRNAARFFESYGFPTAYFPRNPFYAFGYANRIKPFLGERPYEDGETDFSRLRPAYRHLYQQALRMYWSHVQKKGWADRLVLYVSDEPSEWRPGVRERLKAVCDMIHEVDARIPTYSSTWRYEPMWRDALDVWGCGAYGCFPTTKMEELRKRGRRLWFTTDGQFVIDTPFCALEQLLPLYAEAHGVERFEYWGIDWVSNDPWKFGWHGYVLENKFRGVNGDGYMVYPPKFGDLRPCASVRLAAIRDGMELRSYLERLTELSCGKTEKTDEARLLLSECRRLAAIPNAGGRFSTRLLSDPLAIDRLRRRMGELISRKSKFGYKSTNK